jgi:metal-responsive CopG/Arc/MetJ family transcriptional regulator
MAMKKLTVAMTDEMYNELDNERKKRRLATVAETARVVIGDYLARGYWVESARKLANE